MRVTGLSSGVFMDISELKRKRDIVNNSENWNTVLSWSCKLPPRNLCDLSLLRVGLVSELAELKLGMRFAWKVELGDTFVCYSLILIGYFKWGPGIDGCLHVLVLPEFTIQKTGQGKTQVIATNGISLAIRNRMLWQLKRGMCKPTMFWMGEGKLSGRGVTSAIR